MTSSIANRLKAVIVDDERLARNKLRSLLVAHPVIEILGEADGVTSGLKLIDATKPDVVFLDIQMPGASGFDLLNRAQSSFRVVFVTAFDEFAIRAFEVNALDYLLKPVNPARLATAVERLCLSVSPEVPTNGRVLDYDDYLFVTTRENSRFLKVSSIKCILAAGVYTEIITSDSGKLSVLRSLGEWEERLPQKHFKRIHRSTIVNLEYIERVDKWFNYSYQVHLRGIKEPFIMSRRYASKLKDKLT